MKKFLLFFIFLISIPVFGLCSIDGESVCSVETNREMPLFQLSDTEKNNSFDNQNNFLKPSNINNNSQQNRDQSGIDINSSLGCKFGNCNQGLNNSFLKNK